MYNSFEEMPVRKIAMTMATEIFDITINLPRNEDYGLTSQIRRSALSVSANIAEGFGRSTTLDKKRFYIMARGSAFETKSHLIYGELVDYFSKEKVDKIKENIESLIFDLNKLIKSLN